MIKTLSKKITCCIWIFILLFFSIAIGQNLIESIDFEGNKKFNDKVYYKWIVLKEGMSWRTEILDLINKRIINGLNDKGYLYARIDSVVINQPDKNSNISLIWYVEEGLPFRLGKINMEADSIYMDDIKEELDLKMGEFYSEDKIESEILRINKLFSNKGYPFTEISISGVSVKRKKKYFEVDINFNIDSKDMVYIDRLLLEGNKVTHDNVILREIGIKEGDLYNQNKINQISQLLDRLGFFKNVNEPLFAYQKNSETALIIKVEEGNSTTFDGVLGYMPPEENGKNKDGYFNGLIQIYFRNLFGTGRRFEVNWQKPDQYSEEFKLYYEEPWIFHFPVNIGLGLERIVRDTTYLEQSYFMNGALRLTDNFKITFAVSQANVIPDSTMSRDLRLAKNTTKSTSIGIDYDTRDYPINPRRGILYRTTYSYGLKENTGPGYLILEDKLPEKEEIQTINVEMSYFMNILKNQVLYMKMVGTKKKGNKDRLQLTDHIWFGGSRSLRGYRENQFHGTTVAWINLEYRFLMTRNSRLFIFNDWGFYSAKEEGKLKENILPGYGIGIRFDTPLGILGIDYGLGKDDTFSTAKLHFGIINTF